jgi:hypothetical protein
MTGRFNPLKITKTIAPKARISQIRVFVFGLFSGFRGPKGKISFKIVKVA